MASLKWKSVTDDGFPEEGKMVLAYNRDWERTPTYHWDAPFIAYYKNGKWYSHNSPRCYWKKDASFRGVDTIWAKRKIEYWLELPEIPSIDEQPYIRKDLNKSDMEDNLIDIAEILKSYPKGTKLYSPICGECELDCLCYGCDVITVVYGGRDNSNYTASELYYELDRNHVLCFDRYGRYETTGEVMLFPSKNCRDWDAMMVKFVPTGGR